jgi:hypothetical protein
MFAQAPPTPPPKAIFQSAEFYVALGVLAAALLAGAVVIHFIDRWRRQQADAAAAKRESVLDLTTYREMYENGEITQSEYERIRQRIAEKMKREVGLAELPPPTPAPPAQPPNPEEPPPADGSAPPPAGG